MIVYPLNFAVDTAPDKLKALDSWQASSWTS